MRASIAAVQIASLHVYPVKSLRGIAVERAALVARGLDGDRRWMLVDDAGRFVTQRDLPRMALVGTGWDGDAIVLDAPGAGVLRIPRALADGARREVEIWDDRVEALAYAPARPWVERALGMRGDLVFMPDAVERKVTRGGGITAFNDAYPLLVIGEASRVDLATRAGVPLAMARFRPNLVVTGSPPYDEDEWARVRVGDVSLRGVKRCDRCSITSVDPDTGESGKEPLHTLASYRKRGGKVWFGMNLVHDGEGTLAVGDAVVVEERRAPEP